MNFRRLSDNDLADFAANVKELLGGTKLTAIDVTRRASLATAIDTKPDDLDVQAMTALTAEGERKAAISVKNDLRGDLIALMSQVRNTLIAGLAPSDQFALCGFDYRETAARAYDAQDPSELSAFGYSNGVNKVKFKGNNRLNSVVYEIWRRHGDTAGWALHATTKKQSFIDAPVSPGQYYEYKVRASAAKSTSNFSNSAVVYGVN